PLQIAPRYLNVLLYLKENISRDRYIINEPTTKAIAIETNIPLIIASALPLLIYSPRLLPESVVQIETSATATAAPNNSKTRETVVDVGNPKVLNRSSSIMSVSITARKSIIIS